MTMSKELAGFRTIALKVGDGSTEHTLFVKEHDVREKVSKEPSGRTLFVLNVPPFVDESNLETAMKTIGPVESLRLDDKPTNATARTEPDALFAKKHKIGFKVAHVVFAKGGDLKKALRTRELRLDEVAVRSRNGLSAWIAEYNSSIPKPKRIQEEIDKHMNEYDTIVKEKLESEKASGEADDEGWVTVTRQGRKPGFERKESVTNKILATKAAGQKKKELKNFYTFQIRESKMNHIIALRKKFEEDKKKVAALKQSRRFKPF